MEQFVVWFNVITFTLMFAALSFSYITYSREREPWLLSYMLFSAGYAIWILALTVTYFNQVFLPDPSPLLGTVAGYLRLVVSFAILYVVQRFVFPFTDTPPGPARTITRASLAVLFLLTAPALVFPLPLIGSVLGLAAAILFNGYISGLCLYGAVSIVRRSSAPGRKRALIPFLVFSAVMHALFAVLSTLIQFGLVRRTPYLSPVAGGLFCFGWSLLDIRLFFGSLLRSARTGSEVSQEILDRFGITGREAEVITLVAQGYSSREVADRLCISLRTVDTHLYNVYRKLGVRNKVELLNAVRSV